MEEKTKEYPVNLEIDYPARLSRWKTLFRFILIVPVMLWLSSFHWSELFHSISSAFALMKYNHMYDASAPVTKVTAGLTTFFILPVFLLILFRKKYPDWLFQFNRSMYAMTLRFAAYFYCLTDQFPDSEKDQAVHLTMEQPAHGTLHRGLIFVKWLLLLPHYICLIVLSLGTLVVFIIAWIAIIFTAKYPRPLFNYAVGVFRWGVRVMCYGFLLTTDKYPPFSLK